MFKQILILICLINLIKSNDDELAEEKINLIECNLAQATQDDPICDLNKNVSTTFLSLSKYRLPIEIKNGLIIWQNKYQPIATRWSQLCPSPYLIQSLKTSNNKCSNWQTCDQDSFCVISYELSSQIKLVDNLVQDDGPQFTDDLKFINATFDLELNQDEMVLLESTNKLDQLRSKQFRMKNEFTLEKSASSVDNCEPTDLFSVRYDSSEEKLFLKLTNKSGLNLKRKQCYVVNLSVRRASSVPSQSLVQINLVDTRLDKPIFDYQVYNFTISENSPIDSLIGSVHAKYFSARNIKYRIVPFINANENSLLNKILNSQSNDETTLLPVKINQLNGTLSLKLNLDREKYLEDNLKQSNEKGILRLSIESSYASTKYSYSKVNIFIEDVNDNQPIAKLSPLANFGAPPKSSPNESLTNSTMNLYVNENTPVNQILAYLAVYDPDSGENGTIKSIDLSLLSYKQASQEVQTQRALKLKQLKQTLNLKPIQPQVPFRLNKIGEKLYTVQLVSPLDFTQVETYSIEMRIKDNGAHPQLESRTLINVNVIDQNDYPPIFAHEKLVNINVDEDTKLENPIVFRVNAIDLDDGKNGQVKYKLVNNPYLEQIRMMNKEMSAKEIEFEAKKRLDNTFELNSQSGEIKLLRSLNRDSGLDSDYLDLIVMAYDNEQDQNEFEEYQLDFDLDEKSTGSKSLNTSCTIRIRINDKNNNKPLFETNKLTLSVQQSTTNNLKHLGSVIISDLDSYEINSKNFLLKESESVVFADKRCQQALDLAVKSLDSFKILVETIDTQLDQIKCKLSVWSNLNDLKQDEYEIAISIRDNGEKLTRDVSSSLAIRLNVNRNEEKTELTSIHELEARKSFVFVLNNTSIKMKSVFKLNDDLNLIQIDNLDYQIVNSNSSTQLVLNNLNDDGIYLLDLILNQTRLVQIKLMVHSAGESFNLNKKLLNNYQRKLSSLLTSEPATLTQLTQFEGLLLNSSILVANSNLTALLFSSSNTNNLSQFVILVSVVLLFIILVFSCCICLLIRHKCKSKNSNQKNKPDQLKFDKSIGKNGSLNVTDDDDNGGFKQQQQTTMVVIEDLKTYLTDESKTKVSRYLDGLVDPTVLQLPNKFTNLSNDLIIQPNQQSSPAVSMSSQSSSKHTLPLSSIDSVKSSNENSHTKCTLSTTSSSCMSSDEGCYGSSDFSSEVNLKLKQQQMNKSSNLITPIKQQQNYYISNLSRFEKIYNKIDSLLESPSSNLDSSSCNNAHQQDSAKSHQPITSISGSYV